MNFSDKKFLLIEDNPLMRQTLKGILIRLKVKSIYESKNAEMALAAMRNEQFDVILCDYDLGEGQQSGLQLLEEARYCKLQSNNAIFIMITADNTHPMVLGAMENKPDDYLLKPFNPVQLINRLTKLSQRKQYTYEIGKALDNDNLPLAIQHCDHLLRLNDSSMHMHLLKIRTELAIREGDFSTAEQKFEEVLYNRELAWARHGLGKIALMQNQFELAIDIFRQVIEKTPMFIDSYDGLAQAYEATQRPEIALGILCRAVELSPHSIHRQQKLAEVALKTDQIDLAKKAYKFAVHLGKFSIYKSSQDYFKLVKLYLSSKDKRQVNKLLAEMRSQYRHDLEAQIRVAILEAEFFHAEKNHKMLAESHSKIEKKKKIVQELSCELQLLVAKTLMQTGNQKLASAIINQLILNHVDDEKLLEDIRKLDKSRFEMERLIQETKQKLLTVNNHAVNLFKQGQITEALTILVDAMEKMPYNKTILLNTITMLLADMKTNGADREKLTKAKNFMHKATVLGIAESKINKLHAEFSKLGEYQVFYTSRSHNYQNRQIH